MFCSDSKMRLKRKKFRERISDLKRRWRKLNGVIASRSLKILYKHLFFKLPTERQVQSEAGLRHFKWFLHGKAFFLGVKRGRPFKTPDFDNKVRLIIKIQIWTIGLSWWFLIQQVYLWWLPEMPWRFTYTREAFLSAT